jgi:hypothetical protein
MKSTCSRTLQMEKFRGSALLVVILLFIGIGAGAAAYHGMFYVTGSQFYEACWQRRAKEKAEPLKEAEADNPSQAVLWASCTPIMAESMDNAGFVIASSAPQAPEDAKVLASVCPDRMKMPVVPNYWFVVAVEAIEKNGGPSLIDRVAPAGWLIERAMKARWPRCIDAARPYIAKARKDVTQP